MEEKIIEIIAKELGVSDGAVNVDTEIGGISEWDSVHNVQILGALETEFGIKFQPEQIMDWETVGDIIQFIDEVKA